MVASKAVENDGDKCGLSRYYHEVCIHQLQPGESTKFRSSSTSTQIQYIRVTSQILSSNSRVFKGFPGYFVNFPGFVSSKFQGIPGYNVQNQGFSWVSHKKILTCAKKKNTASLFKNAKILYFFFHLCNNPTNKLINKQHFY